jgi:hypothetical protein
MKFNMKICLNDTDRYYVYLNNEEFLINPHSNFVFCNGISHFSNPAYVVAGNICRRLKMKGFM